METKELVPVSLDKTTIVARGGAALVAVVALAAVGTLALKAILAGMALFGLGGIAVAGVACYKLLPLLGQKFDNRILAMQKKEAQDHPIEQLQNELIEMKARAAAFKREIREDNARIKAFDDKLKELKRGNPSHDFAANESKLEMNKRALKRKIERFNAMVADIRGFEEQIAIHKADFELSQMNLVSGMNEKEAAEDAKRKVIREEAINSIRERLSHSFADLELEESMLLADPSEEGSKVVPIIKAAKNEDDLGLIEFDFEESDQNHGRSSA